MIAITFGNCISGREHVTRSRLQLGRVNTRRCVSIRPVSNFLPQNHRAVVWQEQSNPRCKKGPPQLARGIFLQNNLKVNYVKLFTFKSSLILTYMFTSNMHNLFKVEPKLWLLLKIQGK